VTTRWSYVNYRETGRIYNYSKTPLIRKLVIRISNHADQLGPSDKFVENSTKKTFLEITGYRIKFLELQIGHVRQVQTQVHTVNGARGGAVGSGTALQAGRS